MKVSIFFKKKFALIFPRQKELIHEFKSQSTNVIHYKHFFTCDPSHYGCLILLYKSFYYGFLTQCICAAHPIMDFLTQHDLITGISNNVK